MKCLRAIAIALLVCVGTASADDLTGLWKAKNRFGPDSSGPLVIQKEGAHYVADMLGRRVAVRMEAGELRFELPDRLGRFRGKPEGSNILGHWFRYGTPVNWSSSTWPVAVSPLLLGPDGANRWRGEVVPLQDDFTHFLLLAERRPDGTLRAVLRNPEFDFGTQQGVERLVVDGNRLKLMGKRGEQEREVGAGSYDAENEVITLVFPTRGGSYDFRRDGDDSEFYPRGRNPGRYSYSPPPARDDGWPASTLDAAGIDRPAMERFIQQILERPMDSTDAMQLHAVLIARHGKLVLEEYFHGEHRDKPHMTRSAAKSMTAVLVGAAIQAGAPLKLSSPVYEVMNGGKFPAGLEAQKRAMTLEDLLTMSAGYFCDDTNDDAPGNEEAMWNQTAEPDFYRYTMKVPMATPPGEKSVYCSSNPNLALGMVGRATQEFPIYSFDRLIAGPMKLGNYAWPLDPAGNPYGGGGAMFLPRDFLKFGQLMLNGGTWDGRRILSWEFVEQAAAPLYHLRNVYYGYYWWIEDYPYKNRTVRSYSALGAGGQVVTVVPELDLVVAFYAGNYSSRIQRELGHIYVPRFILPAVREAGDDKNAPVVEREYTSPYGRSEDGSRVSRTK
ncbi:MAG TPA: serine hydrolase domain-containing protein [Steroidobacteraceae bacterium]|nr:serine hydrolase domain-containing protein [Steroidobacteraceae bacterium]